VYRINTKPSFDKTYKKLIKKDAALKSKVQKVFELLSENPNYPSLKSHKVQTPNFGECWSSRVTGDIRLIWDFDEDDNVIILVLDIGGHSGSSKVYK
jgi:addiction module RelE/StbE family toxin